MPGNSSRSLTCLPCCVGTYDEAQRCVLHDHDGKPFSGEEVVFLKYDGVGDTERCRRARARLPIIIVTSRVYDITITVS